jgi:hydantoinase/carbamoylase family amidase
VDAATVMARCDALQEHTAEPGKLTRLFATPELEAATVVVEGWMQEAGLTTRRDAVRNLFGRYEGSRPDAPAFLLGSHLDSVPDGGRYDGPLGVLTALAVIERLAARGVRLPFAIEVCAFSDEESVRYGTTYLGSSALAGAFDEAWLDRVDRDGISMRDALRAIGGDPDDIASCARDAASTVGWLELHIEQGPALEAAGLPIGVVTGIQAQVRHSWEIRGTAGHAGTTPMAGRKDALAAAAELVLAIEEIGRATPDLVATVGVLDAEPGAMNVIPGRVVLTSDIRHPDDARLVYALTAVDDAAAAIAAQRGVPITATELSGDPSVPCDARLRAVLADAIGAEGFPARDLASGAGHDAAALARICPVAMLFLRCEKGISHNPAENVDTLDVAIALDVMERAILDLGARP